ncbi:LacI family DNA-binding transcriptional regulator [Celeribacter indicus]|uniref:LacI family transcriptional regulator n=1 Tax=Celeribacter indicus TaxID=1208324 RepID=A0A0B5E360_9RHOB|nr:LacI family DNA-binding transcriptional regulator [Celeribacter indicus]AJE47825.1 LacI family transcriptional regulator [Celeribacter indicus]SDW24117.1 transcriptional regulator, LacI family [Celeribacter indicus]
MTGRKKRISVQSIADELGLSKFAVSRALSHKPGVSEETRTLVIETAHRMGYKVRSGSETGVIKVVCSDQHVATRESWAEILHGLEFGALGENIRLELAYAHDAPALRAAAEGAQGLFLLGPNNREVFEAARASGVPLILVTVQIPPLFKADMVSHSVEESAIYVAEYLLGLNHRKLVYVHGRRGYFGRDLRLREFRHTIESSGVDAEVREIAFKDDYSPQNFIPEITAMVRDGFNPTAFFCGSDGVAVTVLNEIRRLGLRVPQDCTIIGHADYPMATQVSPNLTTVRVPFREIGLEAIRQMKERIAAGNGRDRRLYRRTNLAAEMIERESSATAGTPDWAGALEHLKSLEA